MENVYEYEGRVLLADFEYAKRMGEGATQTVSDLSSLVT